MEQDKVSPQTLVLSFSFELNPVSEGTDSMREMSSVRQLYILHADGSEPIWEGLQHLTSLTSLRIGYCNQLPCLPKSIMKLQLSSLETLDVAFNSILSSLGGGLGEEPPRFFAAVRHLIVRKCDALTALPKWLCGLTSLKSLKLEECINLTSLPDGLQNLTSLRRLIIYNCPILVGRCRRDKGEDWPKIAHIKYRQIN